MDTIIFALIFGTLVLILRGAGRWLVLAGFAACLVASLLLFAYHATDPLDLNF